jgi:hypothetical protein
MCKKRDLTSEIIYSLLISIVLISSIIKTDRFWAIDILIGLMVSCFFFIWLETSTEKFSKFRFPNLDLSKSNSSLKTYTLFLKQFLDMKAAIFILLYISVSMFVTNLDFYQLYYRLVLLGVTGVFISSHYLCMIFYKIDTKNYRYYFLLIIILPVVILSFVNAVFKSEIPELFLIYPPGVLLVWYENIKWYGYLLAFISFATCLISGYVFVSKLRIRLNYRFN